MKGRTLKYSVSVAVLAAMMQATPTFASPASSQAVTQGQINQTKGQINGFETMIQQLDNRIIIAMDKSQKLNDSINSQQGKIDEAKRNIEEAKKTLEAHKIVYSERLRSIQSQGKQPIITYAEILLSSDNISEFLTRSTAISQILQTDSDLLNGLKEKEKALKTAEDELSTELGKLKQDQEQLAAEQRKIEADKQEVEQQLASANNTLRSQQTQQAQQAQQALQAQQQAQRIQAQSKAPATASANVVNISGSASANQVIAVAKKYLGVPYVWGGTSPSGFDCSGFVQYVFREVGINLPRVSRDQQNVGTRISPTEVQPGDLVFRGNPAYHVGIYIGNGQWIQAPESGDVVKISAYNPSSFATASRVLH